MWNKVKKVTLAHLPREPVMHNSFTQQLVRGGGKKNLYPQFSFAHLFLSQVSGIGLILPFLIKRSPFILSNWQLQVAINKCETSSSFITWDPASCILQCILGYSSYFCNVQSWKMMVTNNSIIIMKPHSSLMMEGYLS